MILDSERPIIGQNGEALVAALRKGTSRENFAALAAENAALKQALRRAETEAVSRVPIPRDRALDAASNTRAQNQAALSLGLALQPYIGYFESESEIKSAVRDAARAKAASARQAAAAVRLREALGR